MAQIFHRSSNIGVRMGVVTIGTIVVALWTAGTLVVWNDWVTGRKENVVQPVQFTHNHHVAGLGIDCRFCHFSVEQSSAAGVPPTKVCMNCHTQLWADQAILEPVRESWRTEKPIKWNRVHNLADFAYFNHSIHITKGIGCNECHGQVDQMALVHAEAPMQMRWCLECHTNPQNHVRPREEVTNMDWKPDANPQIAAANAKQLVEAYHIHSKVSCSTCHR